MYIRQGGSFAALPVLKSAGYEKRQERIMRIEALSNSALLITSKWQGSYYTSVLLSPVIPGSPDFACSEIDKRLSEVYHIKVSFIRETAY